MRPYKRRDMMLRHCQGGTEGGRRKAKHEEAEDDMASEGDSRSIGWLSRPKKHLLQF